ncbi:MAG TPA: HEAT repeat domain-containing protein [Solirubrobacterales bacterium]
MGLFGPTEVAKLERKRDFRGLAKAVLGPDPERRAEAKEAIARLGSAEAVTPIVESAEDADGEEAVQTAVDAMLAVGRPAVDHLTVLQKAGSDEQRTAAAPFLARMGDEHALGPLGELAASPRFTDRIIAALALGTAAGPSRVEPLAKLLGDEQPPVRLTAVFSLGRIDDPAARAQLERATEDPEEVIRTAASEALA